MKASARQKARTKYHLTLFFITLVTISAFYRWLPGDDPMYLWSMATGYTSIMYLAITLLIGPLNIYNSKLNPVSSDLRRDVGIWCGFLGLVHVLVGIQVHMGNIWLYFFKAVEGKDGWTLRFDLFGFANYTGLLAALILSALLMLSNDVSLKWLKAHRWKNIQRWNYGLFLLVLIHGIMYQLIEKRILFIVILFTIIVIIPLIAQMIGVVISKKSTQ